MSISEHSVHANSPHSIDWNRLIYANLSPAPALRIDFAAVSVLRVPRGACAACRCNLGLHYSSIAGINYAENPHFVHFSRQKA